MLAGLLFLLPLPCPAPQGPDPDAATAVARYRLDGREQVVTRGDVALEMAFHLRRKDDGRTACTQLVKTALVQQAARDAGVWPEPETVAARWSELQQQMRVAGRDPAREPVFRNCSEQALLAYLAVDLAHEMIVRKELSLRPDEQVSPAMLQLWLEEARGRTAVVDDPDQLPLGTAVRVGPRDVPLLDLGILLLRSSDADEQDKFVRQVVVLQCVEALARKHDVAATDDDLKRELTMRAAMAGGDPRFGGLSFEQLLSAQGLTRAWLLQSRVFRAQVLQKKLVAKLNPRAEVLAEIAKDRPAALEQFGPRRHLGIVFARALDEPNALVPRDFAAARAHLERVRERLDAEAFDTVARVESDDATKTRGGDCGWLQRRSRGLPEPVLAAAWTLADGDVSAPIRAEDGCYLVKVFGIEPPLNDDALVERRREQLHEAMTRDLLLQAAIVRADGTPLDPPAEASAPGDDK